MIQSRYIPQKVKKFTKLNEFLTTLSEQIISSTVNVQQKKFKLIHPYFQIYSIVYQFSIQKPSLQQKMLQQYKKNLNNFLQSFMEYQNKKDNFKLELKNSKKIIKRFNTLWVKYTKFMVILAKKIFTYLDRYYLPGIEEGSLYKIGITVFQTNICHQANMSFFYKSFIKEIKEIRVAKIIQNNDLLRFTQALAIIDMQNLLQQLIKLFLTQTELYYEQISKRFTLYNNSYIKYFQFIYNISFFQKILFSMCVCLNMFQVQGLSLMFQQILITPFTQKFTKQPNQFKKMFNTKNIQYMKLLTQIYKQYDGFNLIRQVYYNYLIEIGQNVFIKPKQSILIHSADIIYDFYVEQMDLITKGFGSKKSELLVTLNNAIQKLISKKQHFTEEFYSFSMNILYNGKFKIKQNKQKITILLQKMFSKDQFIGYYENNLFKKIINKNQINIQTEQSFIEHLNQIYGNQLTHKLSKKLKDYIESNQTLNKLIKPNHLIKTTILSLNLWQKTFNDQLSFKLTLPVQLQTIWRQVQQKYIQIQPKKKLTLLCYQNKLILKMRFNKKEIQIKCNLIQASILLLISSRKYCSQTQIISTINIQKNIVQNILQKIQQLTPNIFLKTQLGDYLINWNFTSQSKIIDFNTKQTLSKDKIIKFIEQDREILIEAAIVKFIKKSKLVSFEQIAEGVINSIRLFKPLTQNIKKSVEKLIKKGYIEQNQQEMFEYVE